MGMLQELKISVRDIATATVVDLEGRISIRNSTELRTALFDAATKTKTVRLAVNMSGIGYIDSSGIATLVEVLKKTRDLKKEFVLFGLSDRVQDVLRLTRLLGLFQIFDNEAHALGDTRNG